MCHGDRVVHITIFPIQCGGVWRMGETKAVVGQPPVHSQYLFEDDLRYLLDELNCEFLAVFCVHEICGITTDPIRDEVLDFFVRL